MGSTGARSLALVAAIVWFLPIAWVGGTVRNAVTQLRPPHRAVAAGWPYAYGFSEATALGGGAEQRWVAHRAVAVVQTKGSRLVLTFRPGPADPGSAPARLRVSTRDRVVLDREVTDGDIATAILPFAPGQKWIMVQIESSRRGPVIDGRERAFDLTIRTE